MLPGAGAAFGSGSAWPRRASGRRPIGGPVPTGHPSRSPATGEAAVRVARRRPSAVCSACRGRQPASPLAPAHVPLTACGAGNRKGARSPKSGGMLPSATHRVGARASRFNRWSRAVEPTLGRELAQQFGRHGHRPPVRDRPGIGVLWPLRVSTSSPASGARERGRVRRAAAPIAFRRPDSPARVAANGIRNRFGDLANCDAI